MIQNNILNSSNNDASESFNNDSGDKIFDWNYVLLTQAFDIRLLFCKDISKAICGLVLYVFVERRNSLFI